jgi:trehalose/maltose hydrolase-like predicted phosphorylase
MITGSTQYLRFRGAELLIGIARLWARIATYNPQLNRYEILGVMGPDEYHDAYPGSEKPGVNNNAYTNLMAVWVLLRALQALDELPPHYRHEVMGELGLSAGELDRWRDITKKMRVVFTSGGILAQFEGYDQLEEFDFAGYRARYGDIRRLDRVLEAENDSTNRYQISKQADVLMLRYLLPSDELQDLLSGLGYHVTAEQLARTVDYYLARTVDGSTLSSVVTSWVLARQNPAEAWRCLLAALNSDVSDVQGVPLQRAYTSAQWQARSTSCCAA